ncbi:putative transmembrane protein 231 [Blattamonas nauphoetae]|uniref:Transmembrane protein 231 n=1 Tax=Blattamonas nauphoetae TaxID=2049346 RepID=A0ABQ9XFT3_9EUKA|nr:putative transmembrane protein 231 [Blattamonas nauphoetae]
MIGWIDFIFLALEIAIPFIILFSMPSFWIREKSYNEPPLIFPTNQWAVVLSDGTNEFFDTSITALSLLHPMGGVSSFVSEGVFDENQDNRIDYLNIDARTCVPVPPVTPWMSATFVYYPKLQFINNVKLSTDVAVVMSYQGNGATAVTTEGQIEFTSLKPLPLYTHFNNTPFINTSASITTNLLSPEYVQNRLATDPVSAQFVPTSTPLITHTTTPTSCFTFRATVHISPLKIYYTPGFWETMKHAWIDFFAVFCLCYLILNRIEQYIFDHQLLSTMVRDEELPSAMAQVHATSFTSYVQAVEHPHHL